MQGLVLSLLNGVDAGIDAVEALLLLAEWMSHWSTSTDKVGRGEEDKVVWMYVGTAVRLGYFMDLDRVNTTHDTEQDDQFIIARKRLVWSGSWSSPFRDMRSANTDMADSLLHVRPQCLRKTRKGVLEQRSGP